MYLNSAYCETFWRLIRTNKVQRVNYTGLWTFGVILINFIWSMGELYVQIKVIHTTRYSLSYYGYMSVYNCQLNYRKVLQYGLLRLFARIRNPVCVTARSHFVHFCVRVCVRPGVRVSVQSDLARVWAHLPHSLTEELKSTDGHTSNASNSEGLLTIIVSAWYFIQNRTSIEHFESMRICISNFREFGFFKLCTSFFAKYNQVSSVNHARVSKLLL